jgi:hypothetical protein
VLSLTEARFFMLVRVVVVVGCNQAHVVAVRRRFIVTLEVEFVLLSRSRALNQAGDLLWVETRHEGRERLPSRTRESCGEVALSSAKS